MQPATSLSKWAALSQYVDQGENSCAFHHYSPPSIRILEIMYEGDIVIVACSFRLTPVEMLNRIRRLIGPRSNVIGYVVSSRASHEYELASGWTLLPTDNCDFDFSAYLTGAERVRSAHPTSRVVIFLNDTLFTNHAATANFTALWRQVGLVQSLELPTIAGKADFYTTICLRNPWSGLDRYVSTYCFMLNQQAIAFMLKLRAEAERDGVMLDRHVNDYRWGEFLAPSFREFLKANLVYRSSPYLWYRLSEAHFSPQQISSKARTIYFEHRLSGDISNVGCMVPTNAGFRWSFYLKFHESWSRMLRNLCLGTKS